MIEEFLTQAIFYGYNVTQICSVKPNALVEARIVAIGYSGTATVRITK